MSGREYPERPMVGVGAVIVGPAGVLLIKRGKPPNAGSWSLPGGAQKLGESIETCAHREVLEETGLTISIIGLIDVVDSIRSDENNLIRYHYTLIDFAATVLGGNLQAGGDAAGVCWFGRKDITALDLWSETRRIIGLATAMYDQQSNRVSAQPTAP